MLKDQRLRPAGCTALHDKARASALARAIRSLLSMVAGRVLSCSIYALAVKLLLSCARTPGGCRHSSGHSSNKEHRSP